MSQKYHSLFSTGFLVSASRFKRGFVCIAALLVCIGSLPAQFEGEQVKVSFATPGWKTESFNLQLPKGDNSDEQTCSGADYAGAGITNQLDTVRGHANGYASHLCAISGLSAIAQATARETESFIYDGPNTPDIELHARVKMIGRVNLISGSNTAGAALGYMEYMPSIGRDLHIKITRAFGQTGQNDLISITIGGVGIGVSTPTGVRVHREVQEDCQDDYAIDDCFEHERSSEGYVMASVVSSIFSPPSDVFVRLRGNMFGRITLGERE